MNKPTKMVLQELVLQPLPADTTLSLPKNTYCLQHCSYCIAFYIQKPSNLILRALKKKA